MNPLVSWRRLARGLASAALVGASLVSVSPGVHAEDFLDPDQAFVLSATATQPRVLQLSWRIAPGYSLYRERLQLRLAPAAGSPAAALAALPLELPAGLRKFDPNFSKEVEVYHGSLSLAVPLPGRAESAELLLAYQGCADEGLCYPPQTRRLVVPLAPPGPVQVSLEAEPLAPLGSTPQTAALTPAPTPAARPTAAASADDDSSMASAALQSGSWLQVAGMFLLFGLLLSLTPCVLPMVPILSSLIVGQKNASRLQGLGLAAAYSLGMTLVYTSLGVAAGLAGEGLAAALQKPAVIAAFAALLLLISLSMFDVFTLQMPSSLQSRLAGASGRVRGGAALGCFTMGAISALMVGPCVAAPLAGALLYISQTRDVALGGFALFCMGAGMSVPLLLTGVSAGSLLPRAGAWMNTVKHVFGLLLVGMAIWTASPLLPAAVLMAAWGLLALLAAVFLGVLEPLAAHAGPGLRALKTVAWLLALIGVMEWFGAASGGKDALQPLAHLQPAVGSAAEAATQATPFKTVRTVEELEQALASARQPVMVDFYADWCTACKEMERFTFSDPQVAARLAGLTLLQADVTANSAADRALLKRFGLFGPPGMVFYTAGGAEIAGARLVGYRPPDKFLAHLERFLGR